MLHGVCFRGKKPESKALCFLKCNQSLQLAMKGSSCVRRVRAIGFHAGLVPTGCKVQLFMCANVWGVLESAVADRSLMARLL